jgi:hypothetical protein
VLQTDLDGESLPVRVQILGVNAVGSESENSLMYEGRSLPWLQDTAQADVWGRWSVTLRDVVILDRHNVVFTVFNAGNLDLSRQVNYDNLKSLLHQAAAVP